jgi:hypothetical protein
VCDPGGVNQCLLCLRPGLGLRSRSLLRRRLGASDAGGACCPPSRSKVFSKMWWMAVRHRCRLSLSTLIPRFFTDLTRTSQSGVTFVGVVYTDGKMLPPPTSGRGPPARAWGEGARAGARGERASHLLKAKKKELLLVPQCDQRIDRHCPSRRNATGQQRDCSKNESRRDERN